MFTHSHCLKIPTRACVNSRETGFPHGLSLHRSAQGHQHSSPRHGSVPRALQERLGLVC